MPFIRTDSAHTFFVDRFVNLSEHLETARTVAAAYEIAMVTGETETAETLRREIDQWLERASDDIVRLQRKARTATLSTLEARAYARRMQHAHEVLANIYAILAAHTEQEN